MAGAKLHPALFWLPVVAALVITLGWVVLRDPSPPNPEDPGTAAPDRPAERTADRAETEASAHPAAPQGWDVAPSNPAPPPPEATNHATDESEFAPQDSTADAALVRARAALEQKQYAEARKEALACLKVEPSNRDCQRARVHTYTQQYSVGETKNILGWCLSAFASDLDCLRAMREFHATKGQGVEASGISAEIRERFPRDDLEMQPLPTATPPSE